MKTVKFLYVYILHCSDNSFYTGITNNPERRFKQHLLGINKESYTYSRRPIELVYCELFTDFSLALEWEARIKNGAGLRKKL